MTVMAQTSIFVHTRILEKFYLGTPLGFFQKKFGTNPARALDFPSVHRVDPRLDSCGQPPPSPVVRLSSLPQFHFGATHLRGSRQTNKYVFRRRIRSISHLRSLGKWGIRERR